MITSVSAFNGGGLQRIKRLKPTNTGIFKVDRIPIFEIKIDNPISIFIKCKRIT